MECHILNKAQRDDLKAQASQYDFLRFTFADMNGIPKGRTVTQQAFDKFIDEGISVFVGALAMGFKSEDMFYDEVIKENYGNCLALPADDKIAHLSWAGCNKYRIGMIHCETFWVTDLTPMDVCPRHEARKQLKLLEELGYKLMSAYEYEFRLEDANTGVPVFNGVDIFCDQVLDEQESLLLGMQRTLEEAGVSIETLQTEYGPGQFELTLKPEFGIKGADVGFLFKEGVKEIAKRKGFQALFMTKADANIMTNNCHFNHSLWSLDGKPVLHAPGEKHGISKVGQYWLGGVVKHGRAITALAATTVNCYRGLHAPWCPSTTNWGFENRLSAFRIKNAGKLGKATSLSTYFECRLGGGSASPYLFMAAVVAAGIDGIKNNIPCPEPSDKGEELPHTLEEALQALEADKVMVEALTPQFVTWYCRLRREVDLTVLKDSNVKEENMDHYKAEREEYLKFA